MESIVVETAVMQDPHVRWCERGEPKLPLLDYLLDSASSELLDHLASQWRVGVWRDSWPVTRKRLVLKTIIKTLSHYGTKKAIIDVLESLGNGAQIKEWFEFDQPLTPHTFQINIDLNVQQVKAEAIDDAVTALNIVKPVRSQYTVTQYLQVGTDLKMYPYRRQIVFARLKVPACPEQTVKGIANVVPMVRPLTLARIQRPPRLQGAVKGTATYFSGIRPLTIKHLRNQE